MCRLAPEQFVRCRNSISLCSRLDLSANRSEDLFQVENHNLFCSTEPAKPTIESISLFQSSGGAISDTLGTARRLHTRRTILQKYKCEIWYLLKFRTTVHKCPMCKKNSIYIWTSLHNHMHEQIIAAKQRCVKCSQSCLVKCSHSCAPPSHDTFVIRFQLRPIFGYFHRQIAICWVVATGICHRRQPYLCNHHRRFVPHSLQMENLLCKSCFILE